MDYRNIPQESKAEILEQAVLNETPEQLAETYRELGYIEMTARALGIACRFCGVEKVKVLAECGATFEIPKDGTAENRYHCYSGMKYDNYRSNYSLYLLKIYKHIKGACCMKGLKLIKQAAMNNKKYLPFLSDSERLEVLRYLCENKDRLSFFPSEMLYHAIFARDTVIVDELKRFGTELSEVRVKKITEGGIVSDNYRYEWYAMMSKLSDEDYLPVMKRIAEELDGSTAAPKAAHDVPQQMAAGGKHFHCTEKICEITVKRFSDPEVFDFFCDHFKLDRINKTKLIRGLIDDNAVGSLPTVERMGWLNMPKKRDEIIEYAQQKNRVECVAWLLDFKNRTADFAAEQAKAEKRMMAELNASPTSVTMLKKVWSWKKQEDRTLIITNYKGTATEVTVPEMIGKSTVTAIGKGAFAGGSGLCGGMVTTYASYEQQCAHRMVTKIDLPGSITDIEQGAFADMTELTEINIPEGVMRIGACAFYQCISLAGIVIPNTVRWIGKYAFRNCKNFKAVVGKGSYAEEYCKSNGIPYAYKENK